MQNLDKIKYNKNYFLPLIWLDCAKFTDTADATVELSAESGSRILFLVYTAEIKIFNQIPAICVACAETLAVFIFTAVLRAKFEG